MMALTIASAGVYGSAKRGVSGGAIDCADSAGIIRTRASARREGFTFLMLTRSRFNVTPPRIYFTPFIHFRIGPETEVSGLPGVMISPYIWVLDEDFTIVAKASGSLDHPSQTYSANIRTTLPHDGSYYEVVRTVDEKPADLIVYLSLGSD